MTLDNGSVAERYDYADYGEPAFFNGSGNAIPGSAVGNSYLFGGMRYDSESGLYVPGSFDPRVATYCRRVEVQKGDCVGWAQTKSMEGVRSGEIVLRSEQYRD